MLQRLFRLLFPPVSITRTPKRLVVETPGLTRALLFTFLVGYAGMIAAAALAFPRDTLWLLLGNAFFLGGVVASVPFWAAMVDLVAPAERATVDARGRLLTREKRLLWIWSGRRDRHGTQIREAFVDGEETTDRSHRKTGNLVFHPMLRLADGTVERVIGRWSFQRDEARAITMAISELLSIPARSDPVPDASAREPAQNARDLAVAERRSSAFGSRVIGGMFLLGALATGLMGSREVHFRQHAQIVSATPSCEFAWRLVGDQREVKHAPCDGDPAPERARRDRRPQITEGLLLDVHLASAQAQDQRRRVFVASPQAQRVRDEGRIAVFWDPANPDTIRPSRGRPLAMPSALMAIGLLILLLPELRSRSAGRKRA